MKPPQRTEAERIAGTLTKAQAALLCEERVHAWEGYRPLQKLIAFGLVEAVISTFTIYRRTPLGEAARVHLLSQDQTDER